MVVLDHLLRYLSISEKHLTDPYGNTALHIACLSEITHEKYQIVETLLKNDFDPSVKSYDGYTAFDVIANPFIDKRWNLLSTFTKKKKSNLVWENPEKTKPKEQPIEVGFIITVMIIS